MEHVVSFVAPTGKPDAALQLFLVGHQLID